MTQMVKDNMQPSKNDNIIIVALGTMGDLNPLLLVGELLQKQGHSVTVLADATKETFVRERKLRFHSVMSHDDWQRFISHRGLWDRDTSDAIVYSLLMLPTVTPIVHYIEQQLTSTQYSSTNTTLIGDVKTLGLRIANEKFGIPLINIHLAPEFSNSFGEYEEVKQEVTVLNQLNSIRAQFGLYTPISEMTMDWAAKCDLVINAFPRWFQGEAGSRKVPAENFDFMVDQNAGGDLPKDVGDFLQAGDAPVVFTLGTGMKSVERFFKVAADVCGQLNLRAIFLCKEASYLPENLPNTILVKQYVPLASLLPQCRAIAHHGGIGTCAQALKSGLPQIIMPMAFDQFGNARRIEKLGVGYQLAPADLHKDVMSKLLMQVFDNSQMSQKCTAIKLRLSDKNGNRAISERINTFIQNKSCESTSESLEVDFI